jgi:hypothetical protein
MSNRYVKLGVLIAVIIAAAAISSTSFQKAQGYPVLSVPWKDGKAPIVRSGNNLYVAWWTNNPKNSEVMFKASKDGGQTFGNKVNLSNSPGYSTDVALAASENNVHVAWLENGTRGFCNLVLRTSTDNGQIFGPIISLWLANETANIPESTIKTLKANDTGEVRIAAEGNNVYVAAKGAENNPSNLYVHDIYAYTSNDNGKTFGKEINLSNSPGINSDRAELTAFGNSVYVSWWEKIAGKDQPLMRISNDNGKTFGEKIMLSAK